MLVTSYKGNIKGKIRLSKWADKITVDTGKQYYRYRGDEGKTYRRLYTEKPLGELTAEEIKASWDAVFTPPEGQSFHDHNKLVYELRSIPEYLLKLFKPFLYAQNDAQTRFLYKCDTNCAFIVKDPETKRHYVIAKWTCDEGDDSVSDILRRQIANSYIVSKFENDSSYYDPITGISWSIKSLDEITVTINKGRHATYTFDIPEDEYEIFTTESEWSMPWDRHFYRLEKFMQKRRSSNMNERLQWI